MAVFIPKDGKSLSNFIWTVADDLWGDFKHTDFARIIIPLMLLRRLECMLEDTKDDVVEQYSLLKDSGIDLDLTLPSFSGFPFYNASKYTLKTVGSTSTRANLEHYISHFSSNVRIVFDEFAFQNTLLELDKAKLLYRMVNHFDGIDLHTNVCSDRDMSNAYEDLIRKFAASINDKAGEFMTPRDAVRLGTKLALNPDENIFTESGVIRSIYDPTCGVGGFLSDAIEQIKELSPTAKVVPFGQELDPRTHAMALTSMLIQGYDESKIKQGNTLSDDKLQTEKFHYGFSNPPFGIKWEKAKDEVFAEHDNLGFAGRFGAGLPRISDGSMLFLLHLVDKMELPQNGGGRVSIVLSGSPLFTGDAGSGESEIRRWLLEKDYVEGILALPNDMFFNTGIGTYIWILSNHKTAERKNKVQLINLSDTWTPMRKSEGSKRRYISENQINDIVRDYDAFVENKNVKIFNTTDFAYRKVAIKRPLKAIIDITQDKIDSLIGVKAFAKLTDEQKNAWLGYFKDNIGQHDYSHVIDAAKSHNNQGDFGKVGAPLGKAFTTHFMERDENAPIVTDAKGNAIADTTLNDNETVPYDESVESYLEREVTPHVPDAFIDYSVRDKKDGEVGIVGYEINFNRYFYEYVPPRPLAKIDSDLKASETRIQALLDEVAE